MFDIIRKKNILLAPEEMTRQLVVHYLIHEKGYRKALIQVEKAIKVNGLLRRYDIISYDHSFSPFLLVECKSHKIKLTQESFDQIARYNLSLKVKYLLITNGIQFYCYQMDYENQRYSKILDIPTFKLEK